MVTPCNAYSSFEHVSFDELIRVSDNITHTLFPDGKYQEKRVSTFLVTVSTGNFMLLLADASEFFQLRNTVDSLRELCPVIFNCTSCQCSGELHQAICDYGEAIRGTPKLVALCVKLNEGSIENDDPHAAMVRMVKGDVEQMDVGRYTLSRIVSQGDHLHGNGLAFESDNRIICSWFQGAHPSALTKPDQRVQERINELERQIKDKEQQRAQCSKWEGWPIDLGIIESEIANLKAELELSRAYLAAQRVSSTAHPAFQCTITMCIDTGEALERLRRHIAEKIGGLIDLALSRTSWQALCIQRVVIENFIRQKLRLLTDKVKVLVRSQAEGSTEWSEFRDGDLQQRRQGIDQTFEMYQRELCAQGASSEAVVVLWDQGLSEKLQWVSSKLHEADEQLKRSGGHSFVPDDVRVFETDLDEMLRILRRRGLATYSLAESIGRRNQESAIVRQAIQNGESVLLVKGAAEKAEIMVSVDQQRVPSPGRTDPSD